MEYFALALVGVLILTAAFLLWPNSDRYERDQIDLDRQWTEMQLEQLAREARARMYRAVDDFRRDQRSGGL